ncbi:uncharacterized protein LOC143853955 [Tasmannia lanceolata]|uniref:uncharacterized protein LOC143853955 n=1 Tax=Tasmannia lanceolata TaxID=3420 RepID=UPI004062EA4D
MDPPIVDNPSLGQTSSSSTPISTSSGDASFLPMTTVKLDGSNYMNWKVAVEVYLIPKRKVYIIRCDPPAVLDPTYEQWKTDDAHIRSLLWQSMITQISRTMMQLPTAKRIWDHTAVMFSGVGNLSRISATYSEWMHLRRGDTPLSTYYGQFEVYQRAQQCLGGASLTPAVFYDHATAAYAVGDRPARGGGMFGRGRGRDSSRGGRTMGTDFSSGRGYGGRPRPYCTHCRREGHRDETCYVLHPERRPPPPSQFGRSAHLSTLEDSDPRASSFGSSPAVPSFTQADYDELQRLHLAAHPSSAGFAQPGSTPASLLSSSSSWIIDSGASNHVTGTLSSLRSFHPLSSESMTLVDGRTTPISGTGSTSPYPGLTLSYDLATGRTIGKGREVDGLYRLDGGPPVPFYTVLSTPTSGTAALFDCTLKCLRTDNAREYFSTTHGFQDFLSSRGILHQSSCAHTSQQNGVAERKMRSLLDGARSLLIKMRVPKSYWGDAVLTACHLANRLPSSVLGGSSPFDVLYPGHDPFPITPRVFWCVCFVHHLGPGFDKIDPRAERCIFLGYSRTQKGYHCYSPRLCRSFVSADVTFFESESYFVSSHETPSTVPDSDLPLPLPTLPAPLLSPPAPEATEAPPPAPPQTYPRQPRSTAHPRRPRSTAHPPLPAPSSLQPEITPPTSQVPLSPTPSDSPIASRTRSHSTAHPISYVISYDSLTPMFRSFVSSLSSVSLPQSLPAALDHSGWRAAMDLEMEALQANKTWELVPLPPGARPVGCRWVYAVKHLPDGTIERLKAQLVAKGYTQTFGVDYLETFSPVA